MTKSKAGGRGGKHRKPGDWIAVAKGRMNRDREIIHRGDRDLPNVSDVGSAAYRRLMKKQTR